MRSVSRSGRNEFARVGLLLSGGRGVIDHDLVLPIASAGRFLLFGLCGLVSNGRLSGLILLVFVVLGVLVGIGVESFHELGDVLQVVVSDIQIFMLSLNEDEPQGYREPWKVQSRCQPDRAWWAVT